MKPILFTLPMARNLRDHNSELTRRPVRYKSEHYGTTDVPGNAKYLGSHEGSFVFDIYGEKISIKGPHKVGDILYVREQFFKDTSRYMYAADYSENEVFYRYGKAFNVPWSSPMLMPKEAARFFIRVTDIYPEHIGFQTQESAKLEGFSSCSEAKYSYFMFFPNSEWAWVIHHERISKEEAFALEPTPKKKKEKKESKGNA